MTAEDNERDEGEGTEPEASEPEATELDAAEPEAPEPDAAEPEAPEPDAAEPDAAAASEIASEAAELEAAQPEATEPPADEPAAAESESTGATPAETERAKPGAAAAEQGGGEVVPGADLDPIAIDDARELTAEERARVEAEEEERAQREAAVADRDEEELPSRKAAAVPADALIQATGKRKSSIARVILRAGDGNLEINGRTLDDYFPRPNHQSMARQPLVTAGYDGNVDIKVRVEGGGISGQAGAVRHGIARALVDLEPELRGDLKRRGLLTRDAREKERRKAGLKKARKRPQFSKR